MVNAQEYINQKYPLEEREFIKELDIRNLELESHLDLRDFINLEELNCEKNQLTSIDISNCPKLRGLRCGLNLLTSVEFLSKLPNPKALIFLSISNNNFAPTTLEFLRPFVNLSVSQLQIGTGYLKRIKQNIYNRFYGSLEPLKDTKIRGLCIAATDIDSGLEYLPESLAKRTSEEVLKGKSVIFFMDCQPKRSDAKVARIQEELRPFNYDVLAWQLARPEKMLIARPEYFINEDSKGKWLEALKNKIRESKETLNYITQNQADKTVKIARLETQIKILEEVENQLREEMEEEREIHEDAMNAMDNFYRQNPPREDLRLKNILQQFEEKYLKLNRENKQKEQKIEELEGTIETVEKIVEQEYHPKETKEQGTQTELTREELEKQQKEIKELREQINKLTVKK